jgi:hypothetical protein
MHEMNGYEHLFTPVIQHNNKNLTSIILIKLNVNDN